MILFTSSTDTLSNPQQTGTHHHVCLWISLVFLPRKELFMLDAIQWQESMLFRKNALPQTIPELVTFCGESWKACFLAGCPTEKQPCQWFSCCSDMCHGRYQKALRALIHWEDLGSDYESSDSASFLLVIKGARVPVKLEVPTRW